jgi:arylesterase/paraoxonase
MVREMRRAAFAAGLALLACCGYVAAQVIPASGIFQTFEQRVVDDCRAVTIAPGTEDVTIEPDFKAAFISADDRRATFAGRPVQGGIYGINIEAPDLVVKVSVDAPADFHPHGISIWRGADGSRRLFAINHAADGEKVEIFDLGEDGMLTHLETISFPEMTSPNDLVAVGPRAFYVTNDRGYKTGLMSTLEAYLALPFASLAYFDGEKGSYAARGLVYANGVNQSPDGKTIYVAELLKRRIAVFERNAETGALARKRSFSVMTNPDNIEVAKDGGLWVAGHPKIFEFLKHVKDPSHPAPSHVIRVNARTGENKEFFYDGEGGLNASSVGAMWDRTLIVGSVFDDKVMVCPIVKIFLERAGAEGN